MKVLLISSGNAGQISPFVHEQVESLKNLGIEFEYYNILGKGISGYLKNIRPLKKRIKFYQPDLIHAHYGLSGLLALIAKWNTPLITTFHGNDINTLHPLSKLRPNWNKLISKIVYYFGDFSIFVTEKMAEQIKAKETKSKIIPCQVNMDTFYPMDKDLARKHLKLSPLKRYILFSSSFRNHVKNYPLASDACNHFKDCELIELRGYERKEVNLLLNASDLALITSFNEGSNQFLKEAMACNRPIVSTNVGDAEWVFGTTKGCYLTNLTVEDVITKIERALDFSQKFGKTDGRSRIQEIGLDQDNIAKKIISVYNKILPAE